MELYSLVCDLTLILCKLSIIFCMSMGEEEIVMSSMCLMFLQGALEWDIRHFAVEVGITEALRSHLSRDGKYELYQIFNAYLVHEDGLCR